MLAAGPGIYSVGDTFWWFLVAEVVGAAGAALASGADSAFLYDTLVALGRKDDFRRLEGNARGLQMVSLAVFTAPGGFVFILGHQAVRGICGPVVRDRILRHTFADKRATVLSLGSLWGRLFFAASAPLIGWVTNVSAMRETLLFQAALIFAVMVLLAGIYRRIPDKYFQVKDSVLHNQ